MKKLVLICLLINSYFAQAQTNTQLKVTESAEYEDDIKSIDILSIHTAQSGETSMIRNGKKDFLFDIFDSKLNKTFSKTVASEDDEQYVGDLFYKDQVKLFTVASPSKNERVLYCQTLNLSTKSYSKTTIFKSTVEKKSIFI